jgi:hypothetical protein
VPGEIPQIGLWLAVVAGVALFHTLLDALLGQRNTRAAAGTEKNGTAGYDTRDD